MLLKAATGLEDARWGCSWVGEGRAVSKNAGPQP